MASGVLFYTLYSGVGQLGLQDQSAGGVRRLPRDEGAVQPLPAMREE